MSVAKKLGLTTKLAFTVFGVLLFSISMCSLLNYVNFEKNYREIVDSRFNALLENLRNRVEYGLNLGLSLSEMRNVQDLITDAQKADSDIAFIDVLDNQEKPLFSAGLSADKRVPAIGSDDAEKFVSMTVEVKNNFDQKEGTLILGYNKNVIAIAAKRTQLRLVIDASIMLGIFGLLGALFMRASLQGLIRSLKYMEESLGNILSGKEDESQTDEKKQARVELEQDFDSFHDSYKSIDNDITDLMSSDPMSDSKPAAAQGATNG